MVKDIELVKTYLKNYQQQVCNALATVDGEAKINFDNWQHKNTSSHTTNNPINNTSNNTIAGITATIRNGKVFEHAGVGFSIIHGDTLPAAATIRNKELNGCTFTAVGVSIIVHPKNPYIPTTHANVRFFLANKENHPPIWWFGGGFDLTPYYPFVEDCKHWHSVARDICMPFDAMAYNKFKSWCDEYFYLPHRQEARGIGGLFFDDLNYWPFATCFEFMQAVAQGFLAGYIPIVEKRKDMSFTQDERNFQLYRRGRYVEFNLLYDRGTLFGLQSGGRIESILMSLPPLVNWEYNWQPTPGSREASLYTDFLQPQDWLAR